VVIIVALRVNLFFILAEFCLNNVANIDNYYKTARDLDFHLGVCGECVALWLGDGVLKQVQDDFWG
jgi:hypothetical protein